MSKTDIPVISVVTPTFNRADELIFLVQSIQNQTMDHSLFEMIISEDGSTDHTETVIQSLIEEVNFSLKYLTKNKYLSSVLGFWKGDILIRLHIFISLTVPKIFSIIEF